MWNRFKHEWALGLLAIGNCLGEAADRPAGIGGSSAMESLPQIPISDYLKNRSTWVPWAGSSTQCNVPDVAMPRRTTFWICFHRHQWSPGLRWRGRHKLRGAALGRVYRAGQSAGRFLWQTAPRLSQPRSLQRCRGSIVPLLLPRHHQRQYHLEQQPDQFTTPIPVTIFARDWSLPTGQNMINALVSLSGSIFVDFNYTGSVQNGDYDHPYKTLAGGVSVAVSTGGTIIIRSATPVRNTRLSRKR